MTGCGSNNGIRGVTNNGIRGVTKHIKKLHPQHPQQLLYIIHHDRKKQQQYDHGGIPSISACQRYIDGMDSPQFSLTLLHHGVIGPVCIGKIVTTTQRPLPIYNTDITFLKLPISVTKLHVIVHTAELGVMFQMINYYLVHAPMTKITISIVGGEARSDMPMFTHSIRQSMARIHQQHTGNALSVLHSYISTISTVEKVIIYFDKMKFTGAMGKQHESIFAYHIVNGIQCEDYQLYVNKLNEDEMCQLVLRNLGEVSVPLHNQESTCMFRAPFFVTKKIGQGIIFTRRDNNSSLSETVQEIFTSSTPTCRCFQLKNIQVYERKTKAQ